MKPTNNILEKFCKLHLNFNKSQNDFNTFFHEYYAGAMRVIARRNESNTIKKRSNGEPASALGSRNEELMWQRHSGVSIGELKWQRPSL